MLKRKRGCPAFWTASTPKQVEVALGGKEQLDIRLGQVLEKYWILTQDRILNKSDNQIRKWRNPRIKAVESFIAVVGNKALKAVTKDDITKFRNHWIERVRDESKNPDSANKDFIHLKAVLEAVVEHEDITIDVPRLFKKIKFKPKLK